MKLYRVGEIMVAANSQQEALEALEAADQSLRDDTSLVAEAPLVAEALGVSFAIEVNTNTCGPSGRFYEEAK